MKNKMNNQNLPKMVVMSEKFYVPVKRKDGVIDNCLMKRNYLSINCFGKSFKIPLMSKVELSGTKDFFYP